MAARWCRICDNLIGPEYNRDFIGDYCLDCLDTLEEIDIDFIAIKAKDSFERTQFENYLINRAWTAESKLSLHDGKAPIA